VGNPILRRGFSCLVRLLGKRKGGNVGPDTPHQFDACNRMLKMFPQIVNF
jgi:hypothetical protein